MAEQNEKNDAVSFVTKKVLVTFPCQVAIFVAGSCIYTMAAICEYQENDEKKSGWTFMPQSFTIVGLPDGRKLDKALHISFGNVHGPIAMVEID